LRTGVGCLKEDESDAMIRLVLGDDGGLVVDLVGRAFGRGAWAHARVDCLERAARSGAARSFKAKVTADPARLVADVAAAADRRVEGLVAAARASGNAAAGTDVAREAFDAGKAELVVVATDGRAAAGESYVARAASGGKAIAWGTKERLGRAVGRPETAVVAILDRGLSAAIVRASSLCSLGPLGVRPQGTEAVVEVR
jgi:predicted RNA-binding protein YlxR (DUF448 family)/ribosomal protein L30E